jgi:hypothetical protein
MTWILVTTLAACTGNIANTGDDDGDDQPVTCDQARTYVGFGGDALEADRPMIAAGSDRVRLKPYGALAAEYARALGLGAFNTATFAATFGKPPARWYQEPAASANTIYAAFALAYDACSQFTATAATYTAPPDTTNATTVCRDLAMRAWHREATDAEAAACAGYAIDKTDPAATAPKRWAYTCAAVLSASGFLAY